LTWPVAALILADGDQRGWNMATNALRRRPAMNAERRFYMGMALVVLLATFLGFAPTYYLRFAMDVGRPIEPLIPLVFVHGLLFSSWVILFIVQVGLVSAGRTYIHRRLGIVGMWMAAVMIPMALYVGLRGVGRPLTAPAGVDPRTWLAVPLLDVPVFGGLIVTGLLKRRDPQTHKRLMLLAMVDMMRPSLGRLLPMLGAPGPVALMGPLLFLVPQIVRDFRTRGRIHPATLWGSIAIAGIVLPLPLFWTSPWWLGFAGWAANLVA